VTNSVKGEVPLKLKDGREFVLVMDFDMRVKVEDLYEKPFAEVAQKAAAGFHGAIRALFWGALQKHHAELTMGDVTALIESHGDELEAAMTRAAGAANGEGKNSPHPPEKPSTKRRAGTISGGNGAKRA
jgi:hypothetical protein